MISIYPAAWNKLYKRNLFNNNILFKTGVWYEDVEFLYKLFPFINGIGTIKKGLYNYVQRANSIISTYDERLYNYIDNWNGILDFYKNNKFYDDYYDELEYCYCRYLLMTFVKGCANFSKEDYMKACDIALNNVKTNFPNYKNNKYLHFFKKIYIKNFNKFEQKLLYLVLRKLG